MSRTARSPGCLAVLIAFGVAVASSWAAAAEQGKSAAGKAPAKRAPGGIIISRETTFLTGPLRKDGSVDYAAALNERYSRGVTPENNAAVLLVQAVGLKEPDKAVRERFFELLGIAPLPEKGPYIEAFTDYFARKTAGDKPRKKDGQDPDAWIKPYEERDRITERPWTKEDSPIAAAWLEENQKQLDLIVAAAKRPRFYLPIVGSADDPETVIAGVRRSQQVRDAARALCARAMFHIRAGRPEHAWQDLLACHRLARLVGEQPRLIDGMMAAGIEGQAVPALAVLAHEGRLTADQARRFAEDFRRLPPMGKMAERVNWGERCGYLDSVQSFAMRGPMELQRRVRAHRRIERSMRAMLQRIVSMFEDLLGPRQDRWGRLAQGLRDFAVDWNDSKVARDWRLWAVHLLTDWNQPMRMGNPSIDRVVAALCKPTRKDRDAAIAELERDFDRARSDAGDLRVVLGEAVSTRSLRAALGRRMGRTFVSETGPAYLSCTRTEDYIATYVSLVRAILALAAYRADHRVYPTELARLVPEYLSAVPEDPFCSRPLSYNRVGAGYVLYSVGGYDIRWDSDSLQFSCTAPDIAIQVPGKPR
jgi:hypothetical protein